MNNIADLLLGYAGHFAVILIVLSAYIRLHGGTSAAGDVWSPLLVLVATVLIGVGTINLNRDKID
jgi:hypothetical protein